ncbi:unnamed protein product [Gongylonema pulchrum]|uniref:Secreted protein n=1 Tax=Gongylonema pulchrum TaxID=637853 RepID=A0A183EIL5_9BILA|nr:unnamed protein product [Gongylonema pulchrum]
MVPWIPLLVIVYFIRAAEFSLLQLIVILVSGSEAAKYESAPLVGSGSSDYAVQKNISHANLSLPLSGYDGRPLHQIRRNPEAISVIREESAVAAKNFEKSRLPKMPSSSAGKKRCGSWLSKIKPTRKQC